MKNSHLHAFTCIYEEKVDMEGKKYIAVLKSRFKKDEFINEGMINSLMNAPK